MRNTTKRSFLTTGLLAAALMALPLAGCKKNEADVPEAQEKVQEAREEVRDQMKDVKDEMKDVNEERRDVAQANNDLAAAKGELAATQDEYVRISREKLARIDIDGNVVHGTHLVAAVEPFEQVRNLQTLHRSPFR